MLIFHIRHRNNRGLRNSKNECKSDNLMDNELSPSKKTSHKLLSYQDLLTMPKGLVERTGFSGFRGKRAQMILRDVTNGGFDRLPFVGTGKQIHPRQ